MAVPTISLAIIEALCMQETVEQLNAALRAPTDQKIQTVVRHSFDAFPKMYDSPPSALAIDAWPEGELPSFRWQTYLVQGEIPVEKTLRLLYCTHDIYQKIITQKTQYGFQTMEEMKAVFTQLKTFLTTCVPFSEALYACEIHTLWIGYVLHHVFRIPSQFCKIAPSDINMPLLPSDACFPQEIISACQKDPWVFHVTSIVRCNEELFAFDILLNEPVPFPKWRSSFLCEKVPWTLSFSYHETENPPSRRFTTHPLSYVPKIGKHLIADLWERYFLIQHGREAIAEDSG